MIKDLEEYKKRFYCCGIDIVNFLDLLLMFCENNIIRDNHNLISDISKYVLVKHVTIHIKK